MTTTAEFLASRGVSRRRFLQRAGATALSWPLLAPALHAAPPKPQKRDKERPNILLIIVDQLRTPQWFPRPEVLDQYLPNLARLKRGAVKFEHYYTAANACTPSRTTLLTGLYTHQAAMFSTEGTDEPQLNPGFPTWGHALRDQGYRTNWWGKWHLSYGDTLEPYGFDGGTYPSPNGAPQQGTGKDPQIVDQFLGWLDQNADGQPWATTVSLVNPHDIMWYPQFTEGYFQQNPPPHQFDTLPPNFETLDDLQRRGKPALQRVFPALADASFGPLPSSGPGFEQGWIQMRNAYLAFQQEADAQIGRVLDALEQRPEVAENTIIVFLSDHGEYAGSHGLRGKGLAAYEEGIHVPLFIKDPTGRWADVPEVPRRQFVSSVDLFGLLLTLASGSNAWRGEARYAHLADRLDVAAILRHPGAPGRPFILHATDENWADEYFLPAIPAPVPNHVIALRTEFAKYVTYSHWEKDSIHIIRGDQETELYVYDTPEGRAELPNENAARPFLTAEMDEWLRECILPNELCRPLPPYLRAVQEQAFQDFFHYEDTYKVPLII